MTATPKPLTFKPCWIVFDEDGNSAGIWNRESIARRYAQEIEGTFLSVPSLLAQLEAASERERGLREYVRHTPTCPKYWPLERPCDCGLDAALRQGD